MALATPTLTVSFADRLRPARLTAIAVLVGLAVALTVFGNPLAHPTTGTQPSGQRGLGGPSRLVEITAIAIAVVLVWPSSDRD